MIHPAGWRSPARLSRLSRACRRGPVPRPPPSSTLPVRGTLSLVCGSVTFAGSPVWRRDGEAALSDSLNFLSLFVARAQAHQLPRGAGGGCLAGRGQVRVLGSGRRGGGGFHGRPRRGGDGAGQADRARDHEAQRHIFQLHHAPHGRRTSPPQEGESDSGLRQIEKRPLSGCGARLIRSCCAKATVARPGCATGSRASEGEGKAPPAATRPHPQLVRSFRNVPQPHPGRAPKIRAPAQRGQFSGGSSTSIGVSTGGGMDGSGR